MRQTHPRTNKKFERGFSANSFQIRHSTERAYTGWPDRLFVIDQSGRVAYKSKPGPFGFYPDEMAKALKSLVPAARK